MLLLFGSLFLPETPRWLIAHSRKEEAKKVLNTIRNKKFEIEHEIHFIQQGLTKNHVTFKLLFSTKFIFPCFLAISIAIFNQLTGINSFLQYAPIILKQAGIDSNFISMIGSVGIGALNFLFTIIAIALIDSIGRRPLLLTGVLGVVISELYLGAINLFIPNSHSVGVLSLIGLLLFIMFFAIGPGVVVWLAISELFPTQVRGKGISVCLFFNSLVSTLLATLFLPLQNFMGIGQTYWLFAFFSFGYFLVVYFFLPETKSRSLEEIQDKLYERRF